MTLANMFFFFFHNNSKLELYGEDSKTHNKAQQQQKRKNLTKKTIAYKNKTAHEKENKAEKEGESRVW